MVVDGLVIPELLVAMLAEGRWPKTADELSKQHLHSRVPEDRNRRLRTICLYAPPFQTIARVVANGCEPNYWVVMAPNFAGFVEMLGL